MNKAIDNIFNVCWFGITGPTSWGHNVPYETVLESDDSRKSMVLLPYWWQADPGITVFYDVLRFAFVFDENLLQWISPADPRKSLTCGTSGTAMELLK